MQQAPAILVHNPDDLVRLQMSQKAIRNPFGFDLHQKWNGVPVTFKGDGRWYNFVGRLADHLTFHLECAVINRYHDQHVAELRAAGNEKGARKYQVPEDIKQKIHVAITGNVSEKYLASREEIEEIDVDFSILLQDMKRIEAEAAHGNMSVDISAVQAQAANEALAALGEAESTTASGSVNLGGVVDPTAGSLPTNGVPVPEQPTPQMQPAPVSTPAAPAQASEGEFPGLAELS